MFLYARNYVSNGAFSKPEEKRRYKALLKVFGLDPIPGQSAELSVQVASWVKANQIHRWFVKHIQNGEDDCNEYVVDREQLEELVLLCKRVLRQKSQARKLLPPGKGFFFGGTIIDEVYFGGLKATIDQLTPVLKDPKYDGWEFYYLASW